jgi:hypothetical protein
MDRMTLEACTAVGVTWPVDAAVGAVAGAGELVSAGGAWVVVTGASASVVACGVAAAGSVFDG